MQDHRIHRDQLFALEPVDQKAGSFFEFELCKLLIDEIEALNGAAVIVLIMADDEPLGHALDVGWIAGQWLHRVRHDQLLNASSGGMASRQRASNGNRVAVSKRKITWI